MPYIPPEVVAKAKEMDLLTYLKNYEPSELVHFGGSTYCTRTHDSLKISNGKWCWFSRGIGGKTALDYLIKVREIPFTEAVEMIVGQAAAHPPTYEPAAKKDAPKVLLLPPASRCATHAISYLSGRGIDREVIDFCLATGRLYESEGRYHNVVFVGHDQYGKARYANLRGIGSDFKGECNGSDKRFSFNIPAENSKILHLFESAIDLLSFATIRKLNGMEWRKDHLLSLAGVYQPREKIEESAVPLALTKYLSDHPEIKLIVLRLDNDRAGLRTVMEQRKADLPKKQAREKAAENVRRRSAETAKQSIKTTDREVQSIKAVERGEKTIKQTARSTGKATVKTTQKSIKTAEQTARTTIKTSQATAQAAQKSAQAAAKASQRAAQAARAAAKATAEGIKAATKATVSAVKAIIAATKALVAAIAAGGWIAVMVIVIICLVGLLLGSCFGIFFSGEDTGTGQTMQTVVREINEDYENQLDTIKDNITYDVLEMSGSRAVWPEVLSVYAVKTTTDPDNAMDVATVDDSRKAILKDIFWQMNEISSRTETNSETVIEETDDGHGNIVETSTTVTRTTLYITVSHKTAEEMAEQLGFTADQRAQLAELLADENNSLWAAVLYGIGVSDDVIVAVALSQVGNIGGQPYWSWYGFSSRVEWCACFVSWCANECGYIDTGVIPKFAGCINGVQWFKDRGQWADNSIEPTPGMIIFFDWDNPGGSSGPQDGQADHVGIVEKCENGIVYTVEGNSGDSCRQRQYPVGYYEILGYGILCP